MATTYTELTDIRDAAIRLKDAQKEAKKAEKVEKATAKAREKDLKNLEKLIKNTEKERDKSSEAIREVYDGVLELLTNVTVEVVK